MKTFIIAYDVTEDEDAYMEKFTGTIRQLLKRVFESQFDGIGPELDFDNDHELELVEECSNVNGEFGVFVQIWCIEDNYQVI